jgi:hypothetical protein
MFHKLTEMVGDIKPKVITIASSANVFAGNEIDRSQVQQFVDLLTRLSILSHGSVILISHPSLTGINTGTGLSGSTQWHNAVRARFYLKGTKSEEGEPHEEHRIIEFHKNNYGLLSESIHLKYKNGLFLPIDTTTADKERREALNDEVYLRVAKILLDQHQELTAGARSSNYAAKLIANHPSHGTCTLKDMEAAQQRFLDVGKIQIAVEVPPCSVKGSLSIKIPSPWPLVPHSTASSRPSHTEPSPDLPPLTPTLVGPWHKNPYRCATVISRQGLISTSSPPRRRNVAAPRTACQALASRWPIVVPVGGTIQGRRWRLSLRPKTARRGPA